MEKKTIKYPVIVEGKYDKIKLSSIFNANIIITDGFGIFSNKEKTALIRQIANKDKVIILTDSDGAGLVIRNHFNSVLSPSKVINLYIPQVCGKEKRKDKSSKEGFLGVEGINSDLLRNLFSPYLTDSKIEFTQKGNISKSDFFELGLSGGEQSKQKRTLLAKKLSLPQNISANAMLCAINILYSKDEFDEVFKNLE